jgi:phosphoglycerate dehydrogenase-like enzyme
VTRLLIYAPSHAAVAEEIARRAPGLEVLVMDETGRIRLGGETLTIEEAAPDIAWADHHAFLGPASGAFVTAILQSPNLTWVQSGAAGFDHPLFARIVAKGAALSISHGQAVGMADYVLWGVLDHFLRGDRWRENQAARQWRPGGFREVSGSRWLIVGFGAIGQGVATRARAFGASVDAVRRDLTAHPLADRVCSLADLPGLLPDADVVVLCAPLNAATRRLADARFLAAMKPRSVLVNVGRGDLVDEAALLVALDLGIPEHVVLDVFQTEPLPDDSRLWSHPSVSVTPHTSGITGGQALRNQVLFLDNLGRFVAGETPINIVDAEDVLTG